MRGPIAGFRGHLITAVAVAVFALGWLAFLLDTAGSLPSLGDRYRVRAIVPTAASLAANARVTMSGVEVGRVRYVERRGLGALVEFEIDDESVIPIPRDSRVAVRQRTPVGENYVSIEPGRAGGGLRSGDVLPASQGDEYVDVDQILSVLQGYTRARARELIQGLGGALDGRGEQLNAMMEGSGRILKSGGRVTKLLAHDRRQLSRLVERLGDISRAVGERGEAMRTLAREGLTSFRAMADHDDAVRRLLAELPSTLGQVRTTSHTLRSVTGRAAPVLAELAAATRELRPATALLRPAARQGQTVMHELSAAAPPLERTLGRLRALSGPAVEAMPDLSKAFCELNPMLRYLRPYIPDVVATYIGMGSASNSYDAQGHLLRVTPVITEQAVPGLPPAVHEAVLTLSKAGLLQRTRELGYDPYPPPRSIGTNPRGHGVLGPARVSDSYQRIKADC